MKFVIPEMMPAAPEIFVFSMACAILVLDLFLSDRRRVVSYWLAQATLAGAVLLTLKVMTAAPGSRRPSRTRRSRALRAGFRE